MIRSFAALLLSMLFSITHAADSDNPMVAMETTHGTITIELWADRAPVTVENFLRYVDNGLYDGLIFHRVIPGFMIQGGGLDADMVELSGYPPIENEADNGAANSRATLAMARTRDIDSATSQFFINLTDNDFLNHSGPSNFGYAVFGEVVEGMDVVDEIAGVQTTSRRGHQDVPLEPVVIESAQRL
ncbi:MAG: peptidylprolyl isomerase [Pseudohongiellaceae bacterium]